MYTAGADTAGADTAGADDTQMLLDLFEKVDTPVRDSSMLSRIFSKFRLRSTTQ